MDMHSYLIVGAVGICLMAVGFFVVTIFSLQDMLRAREKQEDQLRESEEWLRAVLDNSNQIISVKRPDGRYMMVNRRFELVFNVKEILVPGRTDADIFTPEMAALLKASDQRVLGRNTSVEFDQVIPCGAGGSKRHFITSKIPLHDAVGVISGICTVYTDVTERELARRERDRLFELSLDGMCVGTFDGWFVLTNPRLELATGYTNGELTTRPGFDFVHPDDRANAADALAQVQRGEPLVNWVCRLLCKDGSYKAFEWRSMPAVEEGMVYTVVRELSEDDAKEHRKGNGQAVMTELIPAPMRLGTRTS